MEWKSDIGRECMLALLMTAKCRKQESLPLTLKKKFNIPCWHKEKCIFYNLMVVLFNFRI